MELFNVSEAGQMARSGKLLDRAAKRFRDLMTASPCPACDELGVTFTADPVDEFDFTAVVHRVRLAVRYEHKVTTGSFGRRVDGVFQAYLDEPLSACKTSVVSLTFNQHGKANSPGDLVEFLLPDAVYEDVVRQNYALLLAQHVQRLIQAKV